METQNYIGEDKTGRDDQSGNRGYLVQLNGNIDYPHRNGLHRQSGSKNRSVASTPIRNRRMQTPRLSALLCTTALATMVLLIGAAGPLPAHAQSPCDSGAGNPGAESLNPVDIVLDGTVLACDDAAAGGANAVGIQTSDWSENDNTLTVHGIIDVEAIAQDGQGIDADAEARALKANNWAGMTNTLTNYATITASAHAGTGTGGGTAKSFGIYIENWNGVSNFLYNYGDIYSAVSGGSGANANEAHGIRMGQWNGDFNYFENHGNIMLSGGSADANPGSADTVNGFISNQGMNGTANVLRNYGDLTGTAYGGDDATGSAIAVMRGINLANFASTGEFILVENWGDMTIFAQGGDNAGGDSFATAAGIQFQSVTADTEAFAFINYGNMDLTAISGLNSGGFYDAWAFGMRTQALNASELALLANYGVIKVHGEDESTAATRSYGIAFGIANGNANILNTGIIEVTADSGVGRAVGIGTWGAGGVFDGHVYNEGKIVARGTGGADAYAIYLGGVSTVQDITGNVPSVELSTLGFLEGRIRVGGQSLVVNNSAPSHSVHWTAEDTVADPNWGTPLGPVFYNTDGQSAATFDTSMIEAQPSILASFSRAGRRVESAYMKQAMHKTPDASGPLSVWGTSIGDYLVADGSDRSALDADTKYGGSVGGLIRVLNPGMAISLSSGVLIGKTEIDSNWMQSSESDFTTYFAGTVLAVENDAIRGNLGLRVGRAQFDHDRHVNNNLKYGGIETATGDQDATWFSVSGQLGYEIEATAATTVTPYAQVDFLYANFDGYSESGIDSAANVSSYDATLTRVQVGVQAAHALANSKGTITGSLGVLGDFEGGDNSVDLTLLGDSQVVALTQKDDYGVRVAMGFERPMGGKAAFNSGISFVATSSGDIEVSGGLGIGWYF